MFEDLTTEGRLLGLTEPLSGMRARTVIEVQRARLAGDPGALQLQVNLLRDLSSDQRHRLAMALQERRLVVEEARGTTTRQIAEAARKLGFRLPGEARTMRELADAHDDALGGSPLPAAGADGVRAPSPAGAPPEVLAAVSREWEAVQEERLGPRAGAEAAAAPAPLVPALTPEEEERQRLRRLYIRAPTVPAAPSGNGRAGQCP